jgi:biopolymer transport protein ExbB
VSPLDLILKPYHAAQNMVFEGGLFVFFIFATGVVLWTIVLERYWFFARILPGLTRDTMERWKSRREHRSWCSRQIRTAMISRLNAQMTSNLLLLKVLVPLSPLLGLIGTVSGMLEVFDSMALRGSADARTMASGVSHDDLHAHRSRGEHHGPLSGVLFPGACPAGDGAPGRSPDVLRRRTP